MRFQRTGLGTPHPHSAWVGGTVSDVSVHGKGTFDMVPTERFLCMTEL